MAPFPALIIPPFENFLSSFSRMGPAGSLAVPSPVSLGPCMGMALPVWLTLLFSGFLPEMSSPIALPKVTVFSCTVKFV